MLTYDKKNVDSLVVISSPWDFETIPTSSPVTGIKPAITLRNAVTMLLGLIESHNNMSPGTIAWFISDPTCENRTIFFNWPVKGRPYHMAIKEITTFINHSTEDFGLSSTDAKGSCSAIFQAQEMAGR